MIILKATLSKMMFKKIVDDFMETHAFMKTQPSATVESVINSLWNEHDTPRSIGKILEAIGAKNCIQKCLEEIGIDRPFDIIDASVIRITFEKDNEAVLFKLAHSHGEYFEEICDIVGD